MTKKELANGNGRIEALKERQKQIQAALAAEHLKLAKRGKREEEKEASIIWPALLKAFALSPQFKIAVTQTALPHITDEKQRAFLRSRGWEV